MTLDEINNLDPANIGNWPLPAKAGVIIILCVLALGAGYYFDTQHQIVQLEQVQAKENDLRSEFEKKQLEAARLPTLKAQLVEINNSLADLQRSLPSQADVSDLIQNISQAAIGSGLRVRLFRPKAQVNGDIYITQPITLHLAGDYHAFGQFVGTVAAMPRIVTQHEIAIRPEGNQNRRGLTELSESQPLIMEMIANIYYIREEGDEEEV